ncbi:MAG: hypothetical protein AB7N80_09870 [Bdellovibrionales bacterium]
MKFLSLPLLVFGSWTMAQEADISIEKTFDATARHCSTTEQRELTLNNKQFHIEHADGKLLVTLIKCDGTEQILDRNPDRENFDWTDTITGKVTRIQAVYQDYQLVFTTQRDEVVLVMDASELGQQGYTQLDVAALPALPETFRLKLNYKFGFAASNSTHVTVAPAWTGSFTVRIR